MDKRIDNLRKTLKEKNLDVLLVSNYYNIYYLSGFKTLTKNERESWFLITGENCYLFTDGRYDNKLKIKNEKLKFEKRLITPEKGLIYYLQQIVFQEKIKSLGIEADDLKISEYQKLKEGLPAANLILTEKLVIKLREIKDEEEIKKIQTACLVADQCLSEIVKTIKIGQTEKEVAFKIELWLKEKNYQPAFYPMVAIDKNAAVPHYDTRGGFGRVKKNSLILIDLGAKYFDYNSDITRVIFTGKPKTEILNFHQQLVEIQNHTIDFLNKSQNPQEVDSSCRKLFADYKLPVYPHSTGHGIGLEVHEYPKISQTSTDAINTSQVFSIEPGIYFENQFGMRIEDSVWMEKKLSVKTLTSFPKGPTII